jgi:hypothetical protein
MTFSDDFFPEWDDVNEDVQEAKLLKTVGKLLGQNYGFAGIQTRHCLRMNIKHRAT